MRKSLFILVLLLLSLSSLATAIQEQTATYTLVNNKVVVDHNIILEEKRAYTLELPTDAQTISLRLEGREIENFPLEKNMIRVNARHIHLTYVTQEAFQNNIFLADIPAREPITNLTLTLVGDENQILAKPLDPTTLTSNAVFPPPTRVTTDGQRLVLQWQRTNLHQGESLSILVRFQQRNTTLAYVLGGSILVLILIIGGILWQAKKHPQVITKIEKVEVPVPQETKIPAEPAPHHLKADEEQIVTLLKQREGQCEQGTLRILTGFSKAKLSSLLKELEERKVVAKETRGKKNLVFLKS